MYILAIDTAFSFCSVALTKNNNVIDEYSSKERSKQAEILFSSINDILKKNNLSYQELSAISVTVGPGSFTGLRVGIAGARGICLALNIPLIGVTSFESIAFKNINYKKKLLNVVIDARRDKLYFQQFSPDGTPKKEPILIDSDEINYFLLDSKDNYFVGNAEEIISNKICSNLILQNESVETSASSVGLIAFNKFDKKLPNQIFSSTPLYIRPPDAKIK